MNPVEFCTLVENAIEALEAQGQYSIVLSRCSYYKNGICCIVGQMMPRHVAAEADAEAKLGGDSSIGSLYHMFKNKKKGELASWLRQFDIAQIGLLTQLQVIHDNGATLNEPLEESIEQMRNALESWSKFYA